MPTMKIDMNPQPKSEKPLTAMAIVYKTRTIPVINAITAIVSSVQSQNFRGRRFFGR